MTAVVDADLAGLDDYVLPERWPARRLGVYTQLLADAVGAVEPPFLAPWYGDLYRACALDPRWLAGSLIANAEKEAQGAEKLWRIAGDARRFGFSPALAEHARDEARHARMYVALLEKLFPDALTRDELADLVAGFPTFEGVPPAPADPRPLEALLDDLVQINIGELRTRIHQMLLRPVAEALATAERLYGVGLIIQRIYDDEGRHILYTAELIETHAAAHGPLLRSLFFSRLEEFSRITLEEVGQGRFPSD